LWDWSYIAVLFLILILNIWRWDIDRAASESGKCSRSVREDHGTLNIQHQVLLRHSVYLRVINVCHGGKMENSCSDPSASTKAPHVGIWTIFISSGHLIYIWRWLPRSEFVCRAIPLCRQVHSRNPDRGIYPSAIGWSIELFFIGSVPWSRLSQWLPWSG
jgi:hypothetical protein